jgi:hypothetical protein
MIALNRWACKVTQQTSSSGLYVTGSLGFRQALRIHLPGLVQREVSP